MEGSAILCQLVGIGKVGAIFRLGYNSRAYFKWRGAMSEIVLIFHFMIVFSLLLAFL